MSKQRYGRPSTGQKGNNRPTVVIDYFISEGLKRARIEEVVIKTKRLVLED
ncbi:hypothetical protein [Streptococcus suis]|uniref:hypothetical protein n=1 Tax=Streptococcus suis TaxID=1307 RepID=UPI001864408B|nr:hypothetical protein [Streptococcus suis]